MQRLAHARRLRARNELAEQDDALGVGRPLRRLLAERRVERIDKRFGGRDHRGLLACVHRRPPLERSLPRGYAPRVVAFKLDLDYMCCHSAPKLYHPNLGLQYPQLLPSCREDRAITLSANCGREHIHQRAYSLSYLVSAGEERGRHAEAELLR